jgi:sec-independent protein translocase protein TatB
MFDFDPGKILVFGIVALAVIPAKDLPRVLRTVGKYVGQMRRMAAEFQGQFMDAMKEADLESVKKEIEAINAEASKVDTSFDPAALMRDNMTKAVEGPAAPTVYDTVKADAPAVAEPKVPETVKAEASEPAPIVYDTVKVVTPALPEHEPSPPPEKVPAAPSAT